MNRQNLETAPEDRLDTHLLLDTASKPNSNRPSHGSYVDVSERKQLCIKFAIFVFCLSFLIIGRFSVPDNEPACVVDNVMNMFDSVNYFILRNPAWRDGLQILCSVFMDVLFLSTAAYWVLYTKTSRLFVTIFLFYGVRATVQSMWFSPFPPGFWWYDPGFPSLVVPYGRGSDFFFSGHIGFCVVCGTEWKRNGKPLMVLFSVIAGVYTGLILLAYQVHYSIDIFVGLFFAHYCYLMIDSYKDKFDNFFIGIYYIMRKIFSGGNKKHEVMT